MTLREALDRFFNRTVHLNGLLHHLDVQLRVFREDTRARIARGEVEGAQFAAGASIIVRDLTEWPSHRWPVHYSAGGFGTQGDEFFELGERLSSREAAWATQQGFEAFESVLKDLLSAYYLLKPDAADGKALDDAIQKKGLEPTQDDFWSAFVRSTYSSAKDALRILRKTAPQIIEAEERNTYPLNLRTWFAALTQVRHAVVHSNMVITRGKFDHLTAPERAQLADSFSTEPVDAGYELRLTVKQANGALVHLTEYGYAVFKALRHEAGLDWRIFRNQGTE